MIDEVDAHGNKLSVAWAIQGHSQSPKDFILNRLVYGRLPTGWAEANSAIALREKTYYSINGEFYFVLLGQGRSRVFARKEFYSTSMGDPERL